MILTMLTTKFEHNGGEESFETFSKDGQFMGYSKNVSLKSEGGKMQLCLQ